METKRKNNNFLNIIGAPPFHPTDIETSWSPIGCLMFLSFFVKLVDV